MKTVALLMLGTVYLVGCETAPYNPNWHRDCQRNYSENSYEKQACINRVQNDENFSVKAGKVGMDPDNMNLPTTDEIRKQHGVGN